VDKLVSGVSAGALFDEKPVIAFSPETESCPDCGSQLSVQKTWTKVVVTMDIGAFYARETVLQCSYDQIVFHSSLLRSLVPTQCTYGFDVIVEVGMVRWTHLSRHIFRKVKLHFRCVFLCHYVHELRVIHSQVLTDRALSGAWRRS
jgi:hypothetical protein